MGYLEDVRSETVVQTKVPWVGFGVRETLENS